VPQAPLPLSQERQRQFHRDLVALGRGVSAEVSEEMVTSLVGRYSETHRSYHTVAHVMAVDRSLTALMRTTMTDATSPTAACLRMAVWFHDAIYDPRSSTNEHDSAELSQTDLERAGVDLDAISLIKQLILGTAHRKRPECFEEALLLDADLAILAAPSPVYDRYSRNVRLEYAHVEQAAWAIGRSAVLDHFLLAEQIYFTEPVQPRDQLARRNLSRERDALQVAGGH
jgi:predicted metal-dependent HD superfamily phosphohydrolase